MGNDATVRCLLCAVGNTTCEEMREKRSKLLDCRSILLFFLFSFGRGMRLSQMPICPALEVGHQKGDSETIGRSTHITTILYKSSRPTRSSTPKILGSDHLPLVTSMYDDRSVKSAKCCDTSFNFYCMFYLHCFIYTLVCYY